MVGLNINSNDNGDFADGIDAMCGAFDTFQFIFTNYCSTQTTPKSMKKNNNNNKNDTHIHKSHQPHHIELNNYESPSNNHSNQNQRKSIHQLFTTMCCFNFSLIETTAPIMNIHGHE